MTATADTDAGIDAPAAPVSTGRPRSKASQEAILAATAALLTEVGYVRLTVEAVATRAGVGKSTIYRWWPTKAALVVDALRARTSVLPVEPIGNSRADLRALIAATFNTVVRSPMGQILPALAVDLMHDPHAYAQMLELLRPRRSAAIRIIRQIAARGDLADDIDADLLVDFYSGALLYRALLSGQLPTELMIDQLTDLLLAGKPPHTVLPL